MQILGNNLLFRDDSSCSLGSLSLAGTLRSSRGLPSGQLRVLGSFAVVYIVDGGGQYRDQLGNQSPIKAGDAILVFPEIPHRYGPTSGRWDEFYAVFSGPLFETMRTRSVFVPSQPVWRPPGGWGERMFEFLQHHETPVNPIELLRFASILSDAFVSVTAAESWIDRVKAKLGSELQSRQDLSEIAAQENMTLDSLRRRFKSETGIGPVRYRNDRRIEAAQGLLRQTTMPLKQIASALGFVDEFHLSNRFKQAKGVSPASYRRRLP